jgi:ATP-dependent protease ClpP protease subunit
MAKELLLYNYYLSNYTVAEMISKLDEAKAQEVEMRINCYGGEVFATWGLFAKVKEHGSVKMKVDGIAASGGGNLLLYAKSVECLSVSKVMLHRADASVETESQRSLLASMNADLRKQLEMKVDADTFKAVTGYTIDQMFNPETRVDIWLTATQMKKLGIVSKIVQLTPEQEKEVTASLPTAEVDTSFAMKIAALWNPEASTKDKIKPSNMTLEEFKAAHPALYAQIVSDAKKTGIAKEKKRVSAWLKFNKIDAEAVAKGISEGAEVDFEVLAEMQVKQLSGSGVSAIAADSEEADINAPGAGKPKADLPKLKTEKEKAAAKTTADFMKEVDAALDIEVDEEDPAGK